MMREQGWASKRVRWSGTQELSVEMRSRGQVYGGGSYIRTTLAWYPARRERLVHTDVFLVN